MSVAEIDQLAGRESSLGVRQMKNKGDVLDRDDLCVIVSPERGLSPFLKDRVAGQILRYDIKPGEPLHFGHLEGEVGND